MKKLLFVGLFVVGQILSIQYALATCDKPWGCIEETGGFSNDADDYRFIVDLTSSGDDGLVDVYLKGSLPSTTRSKNMGLRASFPVSSKGMWDIFFRTIMPGDVLNLPPPYMLPEGESVSHAWRILDGAYCINEAREFTCKHRNLAQFIIDGVWMERKVEVLVAKHQDGLRTFDLTGTGPSGPATAHFLYDESVDRIMSGPHSPALLVGDVPTSVTIEAKDLRRDQLKIIPKVNVRGLP